MFNIVLLLIKKYYKQETFKTSNIEIEDIHVTYRKILFYFFI